MGLIIQGLKKLDQELFLYDIEASIAHANELQHINILNKSETKKIISALKKLAKLFQAKKFKLTSKYEDCHSAIEDFLTKELGSVGKKIHTGRSRNDQVMVAMRLYTRAKLDEINTDLIISLYKIEYDDALEGWQSNGWKIQNTTAQIESKGIEIGSKFSLSKLSTFLPIFSLSYCYLNTNVLEGEIETNLKGESGVVSIAGKELPYTPKHTLNVGLEHNFNEKLYSRIDFKYVSKSYTDFENFEDDVYGLGIAGPIPEYQVWNFSCLLYTSDAADE